MSNILHNRVDTRPKPYLQSTVHSRTHVRTHTNTRNRTRPNPEPRHPTEWNLDLESGAGARTDRPDHVQSHHINWMQRPGLVKKYWSVCYMFWLQSQGDN